MGKIRELRKGEILFRSRKKNFFKKEKQTKNPHQNGHAVCFRWKLKEHWVGINHPIQIYIVHGFTYLEWLLTIYNIKVEVALKIY